MHTLQLAIVSLVSLAVFACLGVVWSLSRTREREARARTLSRLRATAGAATAHDGPSIMRAQARRGPAGVELAMRRMRIGTGLGRMLRQARVDVPAALFVCFMLALGGGAGLLAEAFLRNPVYAAGAGVAGFLLPFFWLRWRWNARMKAFQRQLPDALDLVARALKAGHAFTSGLRMVADEFDDPIGPEFAQLLDEINFGMDPDRALANLSERVHCADLKFFIVSVNIQRETGGNLAEIITNIAALVRERFKLYGKVDVLSAEGKLSAYILISLPFLVALAIWFLNPDYLGKLYGHPLGQKMIYGSAIQMAEGIFVIRHMIKIKV